MTDIYKLKELYEEIDVLIKKKVTYENSDFVAWKNKIKRFLVKKYGEKSVEYTSFCEKKFAPSCCTLDYDMSIDCKKDLESTKIELEDYLSELDTDEVSEKSSEKDKKQISSQIFIVHGHDGELKEALARIIEKQNINAIILSEQANIGKTIIEKFELHSEIGVAIALFTKDDQGKANNEINYNERARQNVVFETGYFMGKWGRDRVILVAESGVELPSDLQGVVYTDKKNWKLEVLKELKSMGYKVDLNKLIE